VGIQYLQKRSAEGILFTDMYQLTMAQLYFRMGYHEKVVQFDHFFRSYPDYGTHKAGFCVNAGLEWFIDWMKDARFQDAEIGYLKSIENRKGQQVFENDFLNWLKEYGNFQQLTIRAIPEGRVIHPNVPITVVRGPLAMGQVLETSLLNMLNYQILIATKAARIREISRGQAILEFGTRRAHDRGAIAGARAALIGGADYSSNVGASGLFGFSPKGTHAHSLVQLYLALGMREIDAFRAYADVYPDECLLLVDTIDTLESGVPNAIRVFEELRKKGHQPLGIRLDSGDLAYLSIQAAVEFNKAGFDDISIVLSNDLDELVIWQIITQIIQEAPRYGIDADELISRLIFGVGTRLITSWGEPALGGVYKLVAVRDGDVWLPAIKISESRSKTPNPGFKRIWRVYDQRGKATADLLSLEGEAVQPARRIWLHHPSDHTKYRLMDASEISEIEPLQELIIQDGQVVYEFPDLEQIRAVRRADVKRLDDGVRRIMNPHIYHVSLSRGLWDLKQGLISSTLDG
jgi:nicotinate phosphoribosyltransferase